MPKTIYHAYLRRCIRVHRKALHLTQVDAAQLVGLTRGDYAHVENGTKTPTIERLIGIANRLGLDTQILCQPASVAKCPMGHNAPISMGQNATR